jgi:hypothetical protein
MQAGRQESIVCTWWVLLCLLVQDMRYFFMMLVFLLISFGLTFSVLMSPASASRLNIMGLVGSSEVVADQQVQVFGSLEVRGLLSASTLCQLCINSVLCSLAMTGWTRDSHDAA